MIYVSSNPHNYNTIMLIITHFFKPRSDAKECKSIGDQRLKERFKNLCNNLM